MPKPATKETPLTAAECARRTGLTVRALRVYERAGLIRPKRSPAGWRLYGADDLTRLNTVVALKGFGLSLAQIRKTFGASPPALAQVLDVQLQTWATRKLAAERAIARIQTASARLRTRASLTIDELCELMRSTEMDDLHRITRELINQHITPEQEREWLTYWAQRGPEAAAAGKAQGAVFREIAQEFHALMKRGAAPESAAAQKLVERSHAVWLESDLRRKQLEQFAWNAEVTRAWFALGSKLLLRGVVPDDPREAEQLAKYMLAARMASKSARALTPIVLEAGRLRSIGARLESAEARRVAADYAKACAQLELGDPATHSRWIAAFGELPDDARPAWEYLAHLAAH